MNRSFVSSVALLASSWLCAAGVALADPPAAAPAAPAANTMMMAAHPQQLTFTNKLEGTKKTWEPLTATAKAGKIELTLVNTLADPHGFEIVGVSAPIVVAPKETKKVIVEAKPGTYKIKCQLHPAHVAGELTVK